MTKIPRTHFFSPDLLTRLKATADRTGLSQSSIVRKALKELLDRMESAKQGGAA